MGGLALQVNVHFLLKLGLSTTLI